MMRSEGGGGARTEADGGDVSAAVQIKGCSHRGRGKEGAMLLWVSRQLDYITFTAPTDVLRPRLADGERDL